MKATDWSGKRVGKLTVLRLYRIDAGTGKNGKNWETECDCGTIIIKNSRSLRNANRSGTLVSCGCARGEKKREDLTGTKVGRLTVREYIGTRVYPGGMKSPLWSCECDCGNLREISSIEIRNGINQQNNLSCESCLRDNAVDHSGKKIGRLEVLEFIERYKHPSGSATSMWRCKCECGSYCEKTAQALAAAERKDAKISCGCVIEEIHNRYEGTQIGQLSVISKNTDNTSYYCQCSCGNFCHKTTSDLGRGVRDKAQISCGCRFHKVMLGDVYGYLTVIEKDFSEKYKSDKHTRWRCRCKCGNETITTTSALSSGRSQSCGCYRLERLAENRTPPYSALKKICPHCDRDLPRSHFGKDKNRPGGLKSLCRKCNYQTKDLAKVLVNEGIRSEKMKNATPSWADKEKMVEIYQKKYSLERDLQLKLNIDHIIPIIHEHVCGLNVPENLQITSERFNLSKSNRITLSEINNDDLEEHIYLEGIRLHESIFE